MTETSPAERALARLIWPLRLTRAGMIAERATRAFLPVWSADLVTVAAFAFGIPAQVPPVALWAGLGLVAVLLVWTIARGVLRFRMPTRDEALDRLDRTMPGRPISALLDHPAIGAADPATQSVWAAHLQRMEARAATARAPEPDLRLSRQDPFALRYVAATAFAMALLFGTLGRVAEVGDVVTLGAGPAGASGPSWEGWVEPPLYTAAAVALPERDHRRRLPNARGFAHHLPQLWRTRHHLDHHRCRPDAPPRMRADGGDLLFAPIRHRRSNPAASPSTAPMGRSWDISVRADDAPAVALDGEVEGQPPGQNAIRPSPRPTITASPPAPPISGSTPTGPTALRLAVDPEPREALVLDLPMPFRVPAASSPRYCLEDLSEHPFATCPSAWS